MFGVFVWVDGRGVVSAAHVSRFRVGGWSWGGYGSTHSCLRVRGSSSRRLPGPRKPSTCARTVEFTTVGAHADRPWARVVAMATEEAHGRPACASAVHRGARACWWWRAVKISAVRVATVTVAAFRVAAVRGPHSGRQHSNVCSWNGRTRMSALRTSDRCLHSGRRIGGAVLRRRVAGAARHSPAIDHRRREVGVCTSDYWPA
jgi:hypothetical protein